MLKYQNSTGTTLAPTCSLRHHWNRKRIANSAWPRKPSPSQSWSCVMGILHDCRPNLPAHKPPHPGQVEQADPEPVEHPVMGASGATWPVIDRNRGDPPPAPQEQGGKIAMHVIEVRHRQEGGPLEQLEAAAGVRSPVAQHPAPNGIRDPARQPLVPPVLALAAVADDEAEGRAGGGTEGRRGGRSIRVPDHVQHGENVGGVVLAV